MVTCFGLLDRCAFFGSVGKVALGSAHNGSASQKKEWVCLCYHTPGTYVCLRSTYEYTPCFEIWENAESRECPCGEDGDRETTEVFRFVSCLNFSYLCYEFIFSHLQFGGVACVSSLGNMLSNLSREDMGTPEDADHAPCPGSDPSMRFADGIICALY